MTVRTQMFCRQICLPSREITLSIRGKQYEDSTSYIRNYPLFLIIKQILLEYSFPKNTSVISKGRVGIGGIVFWYLSRRYKEQTNKLKWTNVILFNSVWYNIFLSIYRILEEQYAKYVVFVCEHLYNVSSLNLLLQKGN